MALNGLGEEKIQQPRPVTLARLNLPDLDTEYEIKVAAERIATTRVIRAGIDAWRAIGKAESFEGWRAIGAALAVGKCHALKVTGANAAWGRNYGRAFSDWNKNHGFGTMPKGTRSWAIALHENAKAIEASDHGKHKHRFSHEAYSQTGEPIPPHHF
jgi:hypothetical protein